MIDDTLLCAGRQRGVHELVRLAASGADRGEGQTDKPGEAHPTHLQLPCQRIHQAHRQTQVISTCASCSGSKASGWLYLLSES